MAAWRNPSIMAMNCAGWCSTSRCGRASRPISNCSTMGAVTSRSAKHGSPIHRRRPIRSNACRFLELPGAGQARGHGARRTNPRTGSEDPDPRRVPAMRDGTGIDEHVFVRGNHKNLGALRSASVPRGVRQAAVSRGQAAAGSNWPRTSSIPRIHWLLVSSSTGSGSTISARGSSDRPTISGSRASGRRIPNCSTGWRASSRSRGASSACTG